MIFVVDENAPWPPNFIDRKPEEGDGGRKIAALREQLLQNHLCKMFHGVDDLALAVSTAVANWQQERQPDSRNDERSMPAGPMPRELLHDIFLMHANVDADYARAVSEYFAAQGLRTLLDDRSIFADTAEDFQRLEKMIRRCHATAVLISNASLQQIDARRETTAVVLDVAAARTGSVLVLCRSSEPATRMTGWSLDAIVQLGDWDPHSPSAPPELVGRLNDLPVARHPGLHWVGLPVVVAAMTAQEAAELDANEDAIEAKLSRTARQQLHALKAAVPATDGLAQRYGLRRDQWRPFSGTHSDIRTVLQAMAERLNAEPPPRVHARMIKLQYYGCDELLRHAERFRSIFNEITDTGCILVIDEYSLFHPDIHKVLTNSKLMASDLVAVVTISPANPYSVSPFDLIERELSERLANAVERFGMDYDPQCELSVGDDKRLKRWLNLSLPHTVEILREARPNRQSLNMFANELGSDTRARVGSLLYSRGGAL